MCPRIIMFSMRPAPSFLFLLAILVFSIQCNRRGPHQALNPKVQNGTTKNGTQTGTGADGLKIQYSEVRPLFVKSCGRCHNASGISPNWGDEQAAVASAKNGRLAQRIAGLENMPPPGTPEAAELRKEERELIHQWALNVAKAKQEDPSIVGGGSAAGQQPAGNGTTGEKTEPGSGAPASGTPVSETIPAPTEPSSGPSAALDKCTGCHGALGISSISGFPHLAGQSASYLNEQLNDFREGKRKDPSGAMNAIASSLSKEDQETVVSYFTKAEPPALPPVTSEQVKNLDAQLKRGQDLANTLSCNGCHTSGPNLRPTLPAWPAIGGQDLVYIRNQLAAFLSGDRTNASTMPNLLKQSNPPLTTEDLEALAIYFRNLRSK